MTNSVVTSLLRINRQRMISLRRELTPYGYVGFMHLILIYTAAVSAFCHGSGGRDGGNY